MNMSRTEWQGWLLIVLGVGGSLLWAGSYPMEQGVSGSGYLVSQSDKVAVLAHTTGRVARLPHKAGDAVRAGDVLLEFDKEHLRSSERALLQSMEGLKRTTATLKAALQARTEQLAALRDQQNSLSSLVKAGFASQAALNQASQQLALAQSEALELQSKIEQNQSMLKEASERLEATRHEMTMLQLVSPVDGQVMNALVTSPGVNVMAGTQVMEIAPQSQQLFVSAQIPIEFADRVRTGMTVDVMFPTLNGNTTPRIKGQIDYLSPDRLTEARTGRAYLEARVRLMEDRTADLGPLKTGLPTSLVINAGQRTLLSYILRPVQERMQRGLQ